MFIGAAGGMALSHLPGLPMVAGAAMGIGAMTCAMLGLPLTSVLVTTLFLGIGRLRRHAPRHRRRRRHLRRARPFLAPAPSRTRFRAWEADPCFRRVVRFGDLSGWSSWWKDVDPPAHGWVDGCDSRSLSGSSAAVRD